jgi:hypothetical protein
MKKLIILFTLALISLSAQAGFGIQAGLFSPTSGLEDNDNSLLVGANIEFKIAAIGIKIEGFYVDSTGRYVDEINDEIGIGPAADIDMELMLAADVMFYPAGTTFFLQAGFNYTSMDANDIAEIDGDIIDNELGVEAGAGILVFDKLLIQGKVLYTPNAIKGEAAEILRNLDENFFGFMLTAGWQF